MLVAMVVAMVVRHPAARGMWVVKSMCVLMCIHFSCIARSVNTKHVIQNYIVQNEIPYSEWSLNMKLSSETL